MEIKKDLREYLQQAQSKKQLHKRFFKRLAKQNPKIIDEEFHDLHHEVFEEVNCLDCAHCCKTVGPLLRPSDVKRLAKYLKLTEGEFEKQYLRRDEDGDLVMRTLPCPFLEADNRCSVYHIRPRACREYPHTDQVNTKEILKITEKNIRYCPAVYLMVERMRMRFQP